jgi:excisionase family DNA binding protein
MRQPEQLAYSISDAAHVLGVSRETIYRLIREGGLPTVRLYHAPRIRKRDLEALLDQGNPVETKVN